MISTLEIVLHLCYEWSRTTPTRFANCPIPGESCWSSVLWKTSRAGRTREISLSHEKVRTWLNQPYTTYLNRCSGYNWVFLDRSRFCWDTLGSSAQGMWQKAQRVDLAAKFPRSQSDLASLRSVRGGSIHLAAHRSQGTHLVHSLMGQSQVQSRVGPPWMRLLLACCTDT